MDDFNKKNLWFPWFIQKLFQCVKLTRKYDHNSVGDVRHFSLMETGASSENKIHKSRHFPRLHGNPIFRPDYTSCQPS